MRIKRIDKNYTLELYDNEFRVLCCPASELPENDTDARLCYGSYFYSTNTIWLNSEFVYVNKADAITKIAHECVHLAYATTKFHLSSVEDAGEESVAYLTAYYLRIILAEL